VKDWDLISKDDFLGQVQIPIIDLLPKSQGEA